MTRHQKQVARLYTVGEAHEGHWVEDECHCHAATDDVRRCPHVLEGGQREAPVGHRAPEVRAGQVIPELLGLQGLQRPPPQCHHRRHDLRARAAPTDEEPTDNKLNVEPGTTANPVRGLAPSRGSGKSVNVPTQHVLLPSLPSGTRVRGCRRRGLAVVPSRGCRKVHRRTRAAAGRAFGNGRRGLAAVPSRNCRKVWGVCVRLLLSKGGGRASSSFTPLWAATSWKLSGLQVPPGVVRIGLPDFCQLHEGNSACSLQSGQNWRDVDRKFFNQVQNFLCTFSLSVTCRHSDISPLNISASDFSQGHSSTKPQYSNLRRYLTFSTVPFSNMHYLII